MKHISTLSRCVYREKSATTGNLVEAMCKATAEFQPLSFDQEGIDEDGNTYRYASLTAINKATKKALSNNGLWLHTDYGFDETGIYAVCVLEHKTGEFVSSTLPIPNFASIHRRKAAQTQVRRALIEGILDLSAEQDTDAQCCQGVHAEEENPKWAANLQMACAALAEAKNTARVEEIMAVVEEKIERGFMNPTSLEAMRKAADSRINELTPQMEVAS